MKKIVVIEKDCGDWRRLLWLKKIVIIEKDCDHWKRLLWLKKILIIEKDCIIGKDCDRWKRLRWLKKIAMIEKDYKKKFVLLMRWTLSSNIDEGTKVVLYSVTKRFHTHKKAQKGQKEHIRWS